MDPAFLGADSVEEQLLACCARTFVPPSTAARIREIAGAAPDWNYVLALAQQHSILPLLARNLRFSANGVIPGNVVRQIESSARANAVRSLAQTSEIVRVVELLRSRGIRTLPYKGPVIAAQAYQDISARQFEDLDVILQQLDVPAADDAIRGLGYEPRFAWLHSPKGKAVVPGEYSYVHSARKTTLELHTEATLRHFPVAAPLAEYLERVVPVDLGGKNVHTFSADDALPVYCIHGTKDFWAKLVWIVDIAEMLRTFPHLDWDAVWRTSERLRAQRMVHLGLALAAGILEAKMPCEVQARVEADSRASALAAEVAKRLFSRDARAWTARERFRYRRQTLQGAAAGWRYAIRLALAPAEEDWGQIQLARPLWSFHALLRPFRLLRKYGSFGRSPLN
jgi:Uncharacterised nucleotidyltransferase